MNVINFSVKKEGNLYLSVDKKHFTGTQYDNAARQFVFSRPAEYADAELFLVFSDFAKVYEPVSLGLENDYTLPGAFTGTGKIIVQIMFRDGEREEHSNTVELNLRKSLPKEGAAPMPEIQKLLSACAFTEVRQEEGLAEFFNLAGHKVGEISAGGGSGEGGGATTHNGLSGRSSANAHPMAAITGLVTALENFDTRIGQEAQTRQSADEALQRNIDKEISDRQSADTALGQNINAEALAREQAINNEAAARQEAEAALGQSISAEVLAREQAVGEEAAARQAADVQTLEAAKDYTDQTVSASGNIIGISKRIVITGNNWDNSVDQPLGYHCNYNYCGYIAKTARPAGHLNPKDDILANGLENWEPEPDYYPPIGQMITPWGRDDLRGFLVISSPNHPEYGAIGFVRSKAAPLLQSTLDYVRSKIDGWDGDVSVPFAFPTVNDDGGMWHAIYFPGRGLFETWFFVDNTQQWINKKEDMGITDFFIPSDADHVPVAKAVADYFQPKITEAKAAGENAQATADTASGAATAAREAVEAEEQARREAVSALSEQIAALRDIFLPVGAVIGFYNSTNPNTLHPGTTWEKLGDDVFPRSVTGTPGGTGGANEDTDVVAHTHTTPSKSIASSGAHTHTVKARQWNDYANGYLSSTNGSKAEGNVATNGGSADGGHTHTVPAMTTDGQSVSVASHNNRPAYIDIVFWKRTA